MMLICMVAIIATVAGSIIAPNHTVYARFCDSISYANNNLSKSEINDLYQNNPCFSELNQSISDSTSGARTLTREQFVDQISKCLNGNAGGIDNAKNVNSCANAVATCNIKMIDASNCTPDNMADIAQWCNNGRSTGSDNCGRINTSNEATFNNAKDVAKQQALSTCSTSGNATDVVKQQNACADAVLNKCTNPADTGNGMFSRSTYTSYGFGDYQKCLNNALFSSAKNEQECTARGGRWIGGTDGAQAPRCAEPVPVGPCEGHGGVDPKDPAKCVDGSSSKENTAEGVQGDIMRPSGQCGAARTNLISCTGKGEQALGDILKIIISVLTVIIGIAATGGLAWAAILYAKAEDNASNVSEAKTLIRNIVIGILLYGFMVAIVNWLVPGGLIG